MKCRVKKRRENSIPENTKTRSNSQFSLKTSKSPSTWHLYSMERATRGEGLSNFGERGARVHKATRGNVIFRAFNLRSNGCMRARFLATCARRARLRDFHMPRAIRASIRFIIPTLRAGESTLVSVVTRVYFYNNFIPRIRSQKTCEIIFISITR